MTEEQIEREVERRFDRLDWQLMNTSMTQADYDKKAKEISRWAELEERFAR